MTNSEFMQIVDKQLALCKSILDVKRQDYDGVKADRFNAFERAATLQNVSKKAALLGMMAKHTTSIYDMCTSTEKYSIEKWEEKITDHINYLLLLRAMIQEENNGKSDK